MSKNLSKSSKYYNIIILIIVQLIIITTYLYCNINITKAISDNNYIVTNYEQCCLQHINNYISDGHVPSFINTIDFTDCKKLANRLKKNKYTIKGLFYEVTYDEIFEYILSFTLFSYIFNFITYIYYQLIDILYICNGLELYIQHYFIILTSVLEAVELIYLEGLSSYLNNTKLIAKNIELIGLLVIYKLIYQLFNFIIFIFTILYNFVLIILSTTNKIYKLSFRNECNTRKLIYKRTRLLHK